MFPNYVCPGVWLLLVPSYYYHRGVCGVIVCIHSYTCAFDLHFPSGYFKHLFFVSALKNIFFFLSHSTDSVKMLRFDLMVQP